MTTKEQRKEIAIKYMKELDIYKPYIKGFETDSDAGYFEWYAGFWAWQDKDLIAKLNEIEEKYNCTVYAITHEFTEFGELYDFLLVTDYPEEWNDLIYKGQTNNQHCAFAYCWNKEDDFCSEFGTVVIESFGGGIRRLG